MNYFNKSYSNKLLIRCQKINAFKIAMCLGNNLNHGFTDMTQKTYNGVNYL